jgi:hypothetical protein
MYHYVELWRPRESWLLLTSTQRRDFISGIAPALATLRDVGIELLGFALNDDDVTHRADYAYLAVWRMPSKELAVRLENAVLDYGFHVFFQQVNARGRIVDLEVVLEDMTTRS